MPHLVHAWVADNHLLVAQVQTAAKSNETGAIPELLALLDLAGAVVSIDAAGCHKNITAQIIKQKADYVFSLRDNHPTFHQEVLDYFESEKGSPEVFVYQSTDGEHGRIEVRRVYTTSQVSWFTDRHQWAGLKSLVLVECERLDKGPGQREAQT